MTSLHTQEYHPGNADRSNSDKLRMAIAMAVILFAGIAGGILLSAHFKEQTLGYETHAAGYLYEENQSDPAPEPAPEPTTVAHETTTGTTPVCQEYTKLVTIGGESETIYGTACRQPDGTWDIVQ